MARPARGPGRGPDLAGPPAVGALSDFLANSQLTAQGLSAALCKGVTEGPNAAACAAGSGYGLRWAIVIGFLGYLAFGRAAVKKQESTPLDND